MKTVLETIQGGADYLEKGGSEANPIAQGLLDMGNTVFVYAKSAVVALFLLFLLMHKNFGFVNQSLVFLMVFYSALFTYHIALQVRYYMLQQ